MAGFITFEGIDGVGKSTQIALLAEYLRRRGCEVVTTREPGGTPLGEALRELLLAPRTPPLGVDTELLLLFTARAAHLDEVIRPALARGAWVLCDRFTDATFAYQGGGRGVPAERIEQLAQWLHDDFAPDLTLWLDLPVAVARGRVAHAGALDRIEMEDRVFFERVRAAYEALSRQHAKRFCVVQDPDGTLTTEQIFAALQEAVEVLLRRCG